MFSKPPRVLTLAISYIAIVLAVSILSAGAAFAQARAASGGFLDSASGAGQRARLSAGEIQTFLPQRGEFTFPAPYGTTGVRLTNGGDCGGNDCVAYIGYSYWNNINNHVGSDTMLIFVGLNRNRGGAGPSLFSHNKVTGQTQNLGPLFSADSSYSWANGEGWYFSGSRPTALYMNDGPKLLRYDVMGRSFETVFDIRDSQGSDKYLWQLHSSYDDRVHSATVRQNGGNYEMLGCVAYREDTRQALYYPKRGDFDECQIDKSGRWLVIKENLDGAYGEDNRIIDLQNGTEQVFLDQDGAAGHSDVGYGYMIAEDNMAPNTPGATRVWQFGQDMRASGQGTLVYELANWKAVAGLGHVTHSNAKPNTPLSQQTACVSSAEREDLPRVNEIVCFRLDGSLNTLVVAPNMTDLNASGGGSDDYSKRPKGNVDVTGEYFVWSTNAGTNRSDVFIVRIPQALLGGGPGNSVPPISTPPATPTPTPTPDPVPAPTPAPPVSEAPAPAPPSGSVPSVSGEAARWSMLANVNASAGSLQKNAGCGGCPDAGGVSEQQLTDGTLTFAATETGALRIIGLGASISLDPSAIAFGLRLQNGTAEVRESGSYKSEISFGSGDSFSVAISGGVVSYKKNGSTFYTSANRAGSALTVNAVLFDLNASLTSISIASGSAASAPPASGIAPPASDVAPPATIDLPVGPAPEAAPARTLPRKRWPGTRSPR